MHRNKKRGEIMLILIIYSLNKNVLAFEQCNNLCICAWEGARVRVWAS